MLYVNSVRVAPGVRSALAAACGLVLSGAAMAQEVQQKALDPVVVTATRAPVPLSQLVADVTVLRREDIDRSSAQDLSGLLSQQPGLEMTRTGGPGGNTSVFTRGADNRFTAVMIDGVRVTMQNGDGGAPWLSIPLSMIDRIEIVRGPASAVYGSDAVAGVVQIFTKKPAGQQPSWDFGIGAGMHGTAQGDASVSGQYGDVDYLLSLAAARSDGTNSVVNPASSYYNPDEDGFRSHSANGRLGWRINPDHKIEVTATQSRMDSQYDGFKSKRDDHSLNDLDTVGLSWTAKWMDAWRSQFIVSDAAIHYATKPAVYDTETHGRTVTLQNDFQFGMVGLHVTGEQRKDDLDNSDLPKSSSVNFAQRTVDGIALGVDVRSKGNAVQVNVRSDRDSDFGTHNTGSVSGGVQLGDAFRLTAAAATAFRAPTLYQRFSSYGYVNMLPESARNQEMGLSYKQGAVGASVVAYRNKITNMIDYDLVASQYRNISQAVLKGVTLQSNVQTSFAALSGSVDFQSARNEVTGDQLLRRARQHASLQADKEVLGWDTTVQLQGAGRRKDSKVYLHGYSVVNVVTQREIAPDWKFQVKVENLFQREYQTAADYGGTERKIMLYLRWTPSH